MNKEEFDTYSVSEFSGLYFVDEERVSVSIHSKDISRGWTLEVVRMKGGSFVCGAVFISDTAAWLYFEHVLKGEGIHSLFQES